MRSDSGRPLADLRAFTESTLRAAFELSEEELLKTRKERWSGLANGAAGVALFFLQHHRLVATPGALDRAQAWVKAAARERVADAAASRLEGSRFGVFYGRGGIAYVRARVAAATEAHAELRLALEELGEAWSHASALKNMLDTYDAAPGFVLAARDLLDLGVDDDRVRGIGASAYEKTLEALLRRWAPDTLLGAAHGVAGALTAALRWDASSAEVRGVVDRLIDVASTGEGLILWPRRVAGPVPDELADSWCNGIAGFSLLLEQAHASAVDARYAEAARAASDTTQLMRSGAASVCCGSAGQAVSLYRHAHRTQSRTDRRRALARLRQALAGAERLGLVLMQGQLGVALVALSVLVGKPPSIPIFDPP